MANFKLTLLYVTIAFVLAASANTDSLGPHRRDHADLRRFLKKRMPAVGSLPLPGQQPSPTPSDNTVISSISSVVTQPTPGSSSSTGPSPSSTSGISSSSSSNTNGPSSSSSSSSSSPTTSPTPSPTLDPSSDGPQPSSVNTSKSVVYLTTTGSNSAPTPTQSNTTEYSSALPHTAVTVLIVLAACIGASVIAWTLIRKWKFRPSSDFEGRMQPIDWQPGVTGEGGGNEDSGLPGHRRPLSRSSSFHSGSANSHAVDEQTRGGGGAAGYGSTPLNPIPDHDFTAGPVNLAPVGGYADLARGATPQPMMQEHHGLAPSVNRPAQYDQYGIPPHHGYSGY